MDWSNVLESFTASAMWWVVITCLTVITASLARRILILPSEWKGPSVVIFLLLVFGAGWYELDRRIDALDNKINTTEKQIRDPLKTQIDTALAGMQEEVRATLKTLGPTKFGEWTLIHANKAERAAADGFLMAYSHSSGTAEFTLVTGPSEAELNHDHRDCAPHSMVRSRAGGYQGAMIPVKEGHFYKVLFCDGRLTDITAHWLPIKREARTDRPAPLEPEN